jgi:hypothetical protein
MRDRNDLLLQVEHQQSYIQYLRGWYSRYIDTEPVSFEAYCKGAEKEIVYEVKVTINESNHVILGYTDYIEVIAPSGLRMDQLKEYINVASKFSIEERIKPTADTLDYVKVEIYDYDLDLIKIKLKEK